MTDSGLYHLRSFEDLIYDAVHLLYLAHDVDRYHSCRSMKFSWAEPIPRQDLIVAAEKCKRWLN